METWTGGGGPYRIITNGPSLTLFIILLTEDMAFGLEDINC